DLKDAALTVRRGTPEGNLIAVKADVTDLGTGAAKIQGEANAQFDQNALTLGGFDIGPEISVSGSALLTLKFKGSEAALDWSADLPLKPLEIAKADAFRKPAGVAGDLKASGHWTPEEFTLVAGKLTVPGIVVTSQGKLRDKSGKFPGMTLAAKSARLEEVSKLVPALRDQGLSGPTDITVRLKSSGDAVTADATARVIDVDFRPKNAGWSLEGMAGALEAHGAVLEIPELRGKLKSAVEGPITIKGRLENFTSQEALTGRLAVHVGKGRINPGQLKTLISQANVLLGTLIDPQQKGDRASPLEMDVATGTFQLGSGTARTDDLTLKGPDVSVGAIGTIHLKSATLDAHMGIKTFTLIPSVVGNIPQVRRLMKEHEGLLKALGVDKELKRLGIDSSEPTPGKPEQPAITKTPMTVMLKLNGPASAPNVTPVLEAALDRTMAARLKSLIE
ncbi:MAG: hypothetical protein FJY85_12505, partial [Deltaproteobacteria bacterium]|nr:hypothetical protein [Deltaproteobacteria bacterium]